MGDVPTTGLQAETRAVIEAVLEALDIPYAATDEHETARDVILRERLTQTVLSLDHIANRDRAEDIPRDLEYLRKRLAEHPVTGYVSSQQAADRLAAGATWLEAVRLDQDAEAGR